MPKMKHFVLVTALLTFTALGTPGAAGAVGFNQFVGLGDSTIDTGYFRYNSSGNPTVDQALTAAIAQGAKGGWAGNGVMVSTILAGRFGLNAAPVGGGGTNYANGSAHTVDTIPKNLPGNVGTTQQIQNYLSSVSGIANPHALYVVSTGNNDVIYLQSIGGAAANPNFLNQLSSALAVEVAALQAAGARTILVPNSFFSAVLAGPGGVIPSNNADEYASAAAYGALKWSSLAAAGVRFIPADLDSVFRYVAQHPTLFGFTPSSVLASNAPSSVAALVSILTPAQQQDYLFIDGKHLTTAGQTIEADYFYSLLVAPSQISMLAETAVQSGLSRAATIQGQIDLSGQHRGPSRINVWASAGANALNFQNAPGFPGGSGIPFGGSMGVDYQTKCGLIVGAAFSASSQTQGFSFTGGHFNQVDEAPSLYAAYKAGPVWGNVVGTYGLLQDKVARQVPLGIFTDRNSASTNGQSLALALRAGGDLKFGQFTTGPVGGWVLQRVRIDGFTETGTSGVTALTFAGQRRDSAVSQLGWRALMDVGSWQPFVEAKWNHEWAGRNRSQTASLTSVTAPSFTMDAAPVASDWATSSLGVSYKLNSQVMLRGSVSTMFLNPQAMNYGGELGLNVSF